MKKENLVIKKPELVAPGGDKESLKLAVEQGADAVYLGLKEFNARRQAENFSLSELEKAVDFAHLRGVKVYLAFNTLVFPSEAKKALDLLLAGWNSGVDAVLIQDWGLLNLISLQYPEIKVHLSTQADIHNFYQIKLVEKFPSVKRVVLAREVSLEDIKNLKKQTRLEFEVFVHGALCCSYSGLCLFSSLVGGRSGNRGLCAQPCRLPYELLPPFEDSLERKSRHYLSLKDLAAISLLPELIEAGVEAFKIEGRLKSAYYVGVVTGIYRQAIDRYFKNPEGYRVSLEELSWLEEAYSRGFTEGHFLNRQGKELVSFSRPSHRGIFLGRVKHFNPITGELIASFKKPLGIGDEVEVWVKGGRKVKEKIKNLFVGEEKKERLDSGEGRIILNGPRHLISPGDRLFKVRSARESKIVELVRERRPRRVNYLEGEVSLIIGDYPELKVYFEGKEFVFQGKVKVEKGEKSFLTEEKVKQKLEAFGTLPFSFSDLRVKMSSQAYLSLSELTSLRKEAEEKLKDYVLNKYRRSPLVAKELFLKGGRGFEVWKGKEKEKQSKVTARVRDLSQARAALSTEVDRVAFEVSLWKGSWQSELTQIFALKPKKELGIVLPPVVEEKERVFWLELVEKLRPFQPFLISGEAGLASYFLDKGFPVFLDYSFNLANPYFPFEKLGLAENLKKNLKGIIPSLELNLEELKKLNDSLFFPLELPVYGWPRVMVSKNCLFKALEGDCRKQCRKRSYSLKDRKGYEFPLEYDLFCRLNLYNSRCFFLLPLLDNFWEVGISCFQLWFLREEAKEVKKICSLAVKNLTRLKKGLPLEEKYPGSYTTGHYFRKVY